MVKEMESESFELKEIHSLLLESTSVSGSITPRVEEKILQKFSKI